MAAMTFRVAVLISVLFVGDASRDASKVAVVVSGTEHVIGTLQNESKKFAELPEVADPSKVDAEISKIGHQAEASFDSKLYNVMQQAYSILAQHATELAKLSESTSNLTLADELLDEAEMSLKNMTRVGDKLDTMENEFHEKLHSALGAKLNPEIQTADTFAKEYSHLQGQAHTMMDPMYSWGDDSEDKADSLNDQTNKALSSADKFVRAFRRHITRHARGVQRDVERKLFKGQDRVAMWRKVNRSVRSAAGHAFVMQFLKDLGFSGLPFLSSFSGLLVTAAAAAVLGGVVAGFAMKSRGSQSDRYQLLSA